MRIRIWRYYTLLMIKLSVIPCWAGWDWFRSSSQTSVSVEEKAIQKWCQEVKQSTLRWKWDIDPCTDISWKVGGYSHQGRALVYTDLRSSEVSDQPENTTLILGTVHGDETPSLYIALQIIRLLKQQTFKKGYTRVVIAPLVNPDGYFLGTRTNAHGVDPNRNFPTRDWSKQALTAWKKKYKSNPRRFPGKSANSEPETSFQAQLIDQVQPHKILAIHTPLGGALGYNGPDQLLFSLFSKEYKSSCEKLRKSLHAVYDRFFPGSLGNFGGLELGIPTLTLELPSTDPFQAERYWKTFSPGIQTLIQFSIPENIRSIHRINLHRIHAQKHS